MLLVLAVFRNSPICRQRRLVQPDAPPGISEVLSMRPFKQRWPIVLLALSLTATLTQTLPAGEQAPPDKALLVVRLPGTAKLTVGSGPTMQTGSERLFLSPPLVAGKTYTY